MSTPSTEKNEQSVAVRERTQRVNYMTPAVNIHQDADGFILEVEMPGVNKSGVEVTLEDGKLLLMGHRDVVQVPGREVYRESSQFDYRRVFDLDPTIDVSRIEASIQQGLLTVRLPKAETAKPRRISVG